MTGPPSARIGKRRVLMAEINVTPMVDVMLVLLIIFMVTAPLLTAGVTVNLPDAKAKSVEQDAKPVTLSMDGSGRIFIGDAEVLEADLPDRLTRIAEQTSGAEPPQVFLRADKALDYGRVMRVMGMLNYAGLNRIALIAAGEGAP